MKKRIIALFFAIVIALGVLAACGSTQNATAGNENTINNSSDAEENSAENFEPIVIKHAYGETVIEKKPERVATVNDGNADAVLALGIVPVALAKIGYGLVDENGQASWTAEAFKKLGGEVNAYDETDGINFEAVNDSNPDIIIAPNSALTKEEYDRLSEIAPTIPYTETAWATTWEDQADVTARALGMEEEGKSLIADTKAYIKSLLDKNPVLEGKTAAFLWIDPSDLSVFYIYLPLDPRAGFLEELGLSFPDELAELAEDGDFAISLSSENIDAINCLDIIVCYGEESIIEELQANDVAATVPAIANGAIVPISSSSELYMGTYVTVLSIPAILEEYVGLLTGAAEKVK